MRIGISLLCARKNRTGVENTALNLVTHLSKIDDGNEYVIYTNKASRTWLPPGTDRIKVVDVKLSYERYLWLWEHLFFLTNRKHEETDLVHFPIGGGVIGYKGKFVLTIFDLKHYSMKSLVKLRRHLLHRLWYKANVKRAEMIITISEYVKDDILKHFDIPAECIRVIYCGSDERFRPCGSCKSFRLKYELPDEYILFVGATTPSKNLRRAIDAVRLARQKYNLDCQFVVAGPQGEEDGQLKKYVKSNNLETMVRFCGYIPDDDMPRLYSNARLFLFPSITEGFGIPPLEAMRCGTPVVAASAASMPEILGEAAIWVNPFSVDSIAEGIGKALVDEGARNAAIEKGLLKAKGFSWKNMAIETLKVYREIGDSR